VLAWLPMLGTDGAVNVVLKLGLIYQPIEALLLTQ
jgi:ABC-type spermidine/putrescine transport system permease subunit I